MERSRNGERKEGERKRGRIHGIGVERRGNKGMRNREVSGVWGGERQERRRWRGRGIRIGEGEWRREGESRKGHGVG